jgi:phospholipid/cholesterol/gamma-HCH transport system substrate-binding protein
METRSNHILVGGVVLAMIAAVLAFIIWLSQVSREENKQYDIFFNQAVDGLARGSAVSFSGVPVGTVKTINLEPKTPEFVRVRIEVRQDTPILQGTTATIESVGFTGVSQIQLDGAVRGAPPITEEGPYGVPVIPAKPGGFAQLLNSAPELLNRVSTLTERLTELLSDRNQNSIAAILENTNRLTDALADRGPEIAATMAETRVAIQRAGIAAEQIGELAATTNTVLADDVRPAMANLNKAIASAQRSAETLDAAIGDARPGLQAFSKQTVPEVGQLVSDLRVMTEALSNVAERVERGGAGSLVGQQRLPDYKGN